MTTTIQKLARGSLSVLAAGVLVGLAIPGSAATSGSSVTLAAATTTLAPFSGPCAGPQNPDGSCVPLFPPSEVHPAAPRRICHVVYRHGHVERRCHVPQGPVVK